jgi:hypothetical protein
MKTRIVLYIFSFLAGCVAFHVLAKETIGPTDHYVVIKFAKTGNTIGLSDKFSSYNSCINSADYHLHTLASKESGVDIQCVNELPTYK